MSKASQRRATQEAMKRKAWRQANPQPRDPVSEAKEREMKRYARSIK